MWWPVATGVVRNSSTKKLKFGNIDGKEQKEFQRSQPTMDYRLVSLSGSMGLR